MDDTVDLVVPVTLHLPTHVYRAWAEIAEREKSQVHHLLEHQAKRAVGHEEPLRRRGDPPQKRVSARPGRPPGVRNGPRAPLMPSAMARQAIPDDVIPQVVEPHPSKGGQWVPILHEGNRHIWSVVRRMHLVDQSDAEISRHLGISSASVYGYRRAMGLRRTPVGR